MRSSSWWIFPLLVALQVMPPACAQENAPPVASARPFPAPVTAERTLANGLKVIALQKKGSGVVTLGILVKHPDAWLPQVNSALGPFTLDLLDKGSLAKELQTPRQVAERLDSLGTGLDTANRTDYSSVRMTVLAQNLNPALSLLQVLVTQPAFSKEELAKAQNLALSRFQADLDESNFVAGSAFRTYFLQKSPYRAPETGLPTSLKALTRDQVAAFHRANYRPEQMTLLLTGELEVQKVLDRAEAVFGRFRPAPAPPVPQPPTATSTPRSIVVIDRPDAAQSTILYGFTLPGRAELGRDFVRGYVFNGLLAGFSGRLNQELRIKRGLTYGVRSTVDTRRQTSWYTARLATKPESTLEAFALVGEVVSAVNATPAAGAELDTRTTATLGARATNLTTTEGLFEQVSGLVMYDQPLSTLTTFDQQARQVTPAAVQDFARAYLSTARTVIVGPAQKFLQPLEAKFGPVERVSYSDFVQQINQAK
ncbi:M16 family metallopeptidase [Anthocerotibacter panamensis]|uniref:M16 family metallopeptidase n=1 Tax=Anthocerotibacter panamensis TaxID=2857077 RepID=UPI001C405782|nr:pitrilysin family protein [Anthocerotibacter panamensis]